MVNSMLQLFNSHLNEMILMRLDKRSVNNVYGTKNRT